MRPLLVHRMADAGLGSLAWLIPTPGAVYLLLFVLLIAVFLRRSLASGCPLDRAVEAPFAGAVGAAIGTRLFYLVASGDVLRLPFSKWLSPSLGTASWGAYLGAAAGIGLYAAISRATLLPLLDIGASCAGIGDLVGRWACLLAGDDFGSVTTVPWAIRFPAGSLVHQAHARAGLIGPGAPYSLPVHPFQIYLMVHGLLVLVVTTLIWKRWRTAPGVTLGAFGVLYGFSRFWWEFLRAPDAGASGPFSQSQRMCMLLFTAGMLLLAWHWWRTRNGRRHASAPADPTLAGSAVG